MRRTQFGAAVVVVGVAALLGGMLPANAGVDVAHDRVVSASPDDWVPVIQDGKGAWGAATVGSTTVVGGEFSSVLERGASTSVVRRNIFAFDSEGKISPTFVPSIGGRVWDVIPAGDGKSVFVAGRFTSVNGVARTNRVARIDVPSGQVMTTFRSPGFNGQVMDLHLSNGKLYVGGYFTTVGGQPRTALVALNPNTGADTGSVNLAFKDLFNATTQSNISSGLGGLGIERFTMTPDGTRLVAIGNFRTVDEKTRTQVAMIDTSGPQAFVTDWATDRFSSPCASVFPTYTLGIDASPDGRYFVIATGAAFNGGVTSGTLCDTVSRWEFDPDPTTSNQQPTWVDYLGGDTGTAVDITGTAVYVGGHFRWVNNPFAGDVVGPGTVRRSGLAALDPRNGLPLSWNPGRGKLNFGVGRFEATQQGLWALHDGDRLGGEVTGRAGLFPLASGRMLPADSTGSLPGQAFVLGQRPAPSGPSPVVFRVNAGGPALPALDGGPDWVGDEDFDSPYRNSGSNAAPWNDIGFQRDPSVPADTPMAIFNHERWDAGSPPEMQWNIDVPTDAPLEVRLYFANGCSCTQNVGQRRFSVSVEGQTLTAVGQDLTNYDIVADVGDKKGTMKTFSVPAQEDGEVTIDFTHVAENPLVNGIEVLRTDVPPTTEVSNDDVFRNNLTEAGATGSTKVANGGVAWRNARGAFMVDGRLYTGWADGTFSWRSFNGTTFGGVRTIDLRGLTAFSADLPGVRGMWFDRANGRMYYTLKGVNELYYRYFTPESLTVGAVRFEHPTNQSVDWGKVSGGFLANGRLYISNTDGTLRSVQWQDGAATGNIQPVSGPDLDGIDWSAGSLFLRVQ